LTLRPASSAASYPNSFSAAGFIDSIRPLASMMMIASTAAARIARVRASLSSSCVSAFLRSVMSRVTCE
jgi:hypothetical protein